MRTPVAMALLLLVLAGCKVGFEPVNLNSLPSSGRDR